MKTNDKKPKAEIMLPQLCSVETDDSFGKRRLIF